MTGRVSELNSRLGNLISVPNNASSKSGASESFQKVMDQTGNRNQASDAGVKRKTDGMQQTQTDKVSKDRPSVDTNRIKDVSSKETPVDQAEDFEEEIEKISTAASAIIAEILNVPQEMIDAAMDKLSLSPADLLNTDNLASLVAELTGDGDVSMFLMDSMAYGQLKEVIGAVEELNGTVLEEFSMTQEEFDAALAKLTMQEETSEQTLEQPVTQEQEESEPVVIVKDLTNGKQEVSEPVVNRDADVNKPAEEAVSQTEKSSSNKEEHSEEKGFQGNANAQNFDQTFRPIVDQVSSEESYRSSHVDTQDIMRQITEQIKLTLKPESTIMEMELNPASLGRVTVHLEAKNGMITAQFAAQNQAVKEAIESQAVQLRETLEEQGVKVDAVEVTIASHEFERNLQQDSGGREAEKEKKAGGVSRKKLNLNLLEEEGEEELSEEEALAKDIMIQNGNSVDYTA